MVKVNVCAPVEYVMGYLRYGHYEGTLELTDEEYEEFEKHPKSFSDMIKDNCNFFIDDWSVESIGNMYDITYNSYREVKNDY